MDILDMFHQYVIDDRVKILPRCYQSFITLREYSRPIRDSCLGKTTEYSITKSIFLTYFIITFFRIYPVPYKYKYCVFSFYASKLVATALFMFTYLNMDLRIIKFNLFHIIW